LCSVCVFIMTCYSVQFYSTQIHTTETTFSMTGYVDILWKDLFRYSFILQFSYADLA